jgi:DUF917 family protein
MAEEAIRTHGPVCLLSPDEVRDGQRVVASAMMGAPTVLVEKVPGTSELVDAFAMMEEALGEPIAATFPIEIGGVNAMIPLVLAAQKKIPVIDADAMGRAFPEVQMNTLYLSGIPETPVTMADEKGNRLHLTPRDAFAYESLARAITIAMGCSAAVLDYPRRWGELKHGVIPGTLTLAQRLGHLLRDVRHGGVDAVTAVVEALKGVRLFRGNVIDVDRRTEAGFAKGIARFASGSEEWSIHFQNEYLLAQRKDRILATTPDLIVVLDQESGRPITTENLRYGMRTAVMAVPCAPQWRSGKGIALVGPRVFGYDTDYVPVEERVALLKE